MRLIFLGKEQNLGKNVIFMDWNGKYDMSNIPIFLITRETILNLSSYDSNFFCSSFRHKFVNFLYLLSIVKTREAIV